MNAIRIRKKLESDTLHLPELQPLIGRTVEITVEEQPPAVRDEFYAEVARIPDNEKDFESQKALFRAWRNDPRFEPYWTLLDNLIVRDFASARPWAAAAQAVRELEGYDFDAWREQRDFDRQHADDHLQ